MSYLIAFRNRVLKRAFYFLLNPFYSFLNYFLTKPSTQNKSLLIVKLDAIGDYVLFRNFIKCIKSDPKYFEYSLTLCGNSSWRNLSQQLDENEVDEFIWINRKKFLLDLRYRYQCLKHLTARGYEILLQPSYSRSLYVEDAITKVISAKLKIGWRGDEANATTAEKKHGEQIYDKLFSSPHESNFEFFRNKEFFENFLEKKIDIAKPEIDLTNLPSHFKILKDYIVIFPGANQAFRKWPLKYFKDVIDHILKTSELDVVICGGASERKECESLQDITGRIINMVGQTSLLELLAILKTSKLLISNETSAPHFAIALNVRTIVISNGNNYGRFTPYPRSITDKYNVLYPPEIEKNRGNEDLLIKKYGNGSLLNIKTIHPKRVIECLKRELI